MTEIDGQVGELRAEVRQLRSSFERLEAADRSLADRVNKLSSKLDAYLIKEAQEASQRNTERGIALWVARLFLTGLFGALVWMLGRAADVLWTAFVNLPKK